MKRFLLFAFLFCLFSSPIFSQVSPLYIPQSYYVSTTGNDTNSGSSSYPFATIHKALTKKDTTLYGMLINVMPGYYHKQPVKIDISGGPNYFIKIQATDTSNKPVFYGDDSTFIGKDAIFSWASNISYVTLFGIKIINATETDTLMGIWVRGDYNNILSCELGNLKRSGIVIQGNYNLIDHNYVHNITGGSDSTFKGNNIDIETSYSGGTSYSSNYNTVQFNTLTNNPTHFGVNIFPFVTDPSQPTMLGNNIYSNYISNTGGGIYTRYQQDAAIINNVIVQNVSSNYWGVDGGGIYFDTNKIYPRSLNANVKIYNNTITNNQDFGILNVTSNKVSIKNNIIDNNGEWYIRFEWFTADTSCHIGNNLYHSSQYTTWKWNGTDETTFALWKASSKDTNSIIGQSPSYVGSGNYNIQYGSPAKNAGVGLQSDGVTTDYSNNPRPYWNKDYDIGAFEVQGDAQLKMGVYGSTGSYNFTITTSGVYWERQSNGTYQISTNPSYSSSTYTVTDSTSNVNAWRGWDFGWTSISNDLNKQFAHGIYKIKNVVGTDSSKYFYLDLRDSISYSPNLCIRFNVSSSTHQFEYLSGTIWYPINNGYVLRIWNINNGGTSNTGGLTSYWSNALECADSNYHPKIIWGPKNSFSGSYIIYKNGDSYGDWHPIDTTTAFFCTDLTESYIFRQGQGAHDVSYKILASTNASNTVITLVNGVAPGKLKPNVNASIPIVYSLNQNYPNPFNPSTIIRYSIPNDGLVILKVYDILGRELETLVNETKQSGEYDVNFSGHNLASGVYIYRLTSGTYTQTKKMQFIK
jgi:hypothetical protein